MTFVPFPSSLQQQQVDEVKSLAREMSRQYFPSLQKIEKGEAVGRQ